MPEKMSRSNMQTNKTKILQLTHACQHLQYRINKTN